MKSISLNNILNMVLREQVELSPDALEAIEIIKAKLKFTDENFLPISKNSFKVIVPAKDRITVLDNIEKIKIKGTNPFTFNADRAAGSSIGFIKYKNKVKIVVKPSQKQGSGSGGLGNEELIVNTLNLLLSDGPKNITFNDGNKDITFENVYEVKATGRQTTGYSKSDADFFDEFGEKLGGISIKQDNAGFWESADKRFKELVNKFSEKVHEGAFGDKLTFIPLKDERGKKIPGIFTMYDATRGVKISGVVIKNLPPQDEDQIIFGSDAVPVIKRTFKESDFTQMDNSILVNVSKIYEDIDDIYEDDAQPVLKIRHDRTRVSTGGVRPLLMPKYLVYKGDKLGPNEVEIDYKKIMRK